MSEPFVCFSHNGVRECLELEEVNVPVQESLSMSESVMDAIKDVDGFKTVICDKERDCRLFKSNPETIQEGLLNLFGSNYWDNPDIKISTNYKYSSIYFVTPDGRNFGYDGALRYMGSGVDLLFKGERARIELKGYLTSEVSDGLKTYKPKNNKPIEKERTIPTEGSLISTNPFEFFHRTNIEPYQSINPDEIPSSSEDIAMRFFSWSSSLTDAGLKACLQDTEQRLNRGCQDNCVTAFHTGTLSPKRITN